ncbi:MAG: DUF308 domain-containing protein [Caulobacteraceae bacterium]
MNGQTLQAPERAAASHWLRSYYFTRAAVAAAWFVAAFAVGRTNPAIAAALLVVYPAWDALANYLDAQRSGGPKLNLSQQVNVGVSVLAAVAVVCALTRNLNVVIGVFGTWAIVAGLLQLITGVRRWKIGAQGTMILAGAQSALVGAYFIKQAIGKPPVTIMDIAPYAVFGALYFLVSAVWLTVAQARRR